MTVLGAPGKRPPRGEWIARLRALQVADSQVTPRDWRDGLAFPEVAQVVHQALPADGIIADAGTFGAPFYLGDLAARAASAGSRLGRHGLWRAGRRRGTCAAPAAPWSVAWAMAAS